MHRGEPKFAEKYYSSANKGEQRLKLKVEFWGITAKLKGIF